jgi:NADPH-dependent 2,4-dienoyl-CoA reductase/sulfur reductase-like enzyme
MARQSPPQFLMQVKRPFESLFPVSLADRYAEWAFVLSVGSPSTASFTEEAVTLLSEKACGSLRMNKISASVLIVGSGPAGLAAAAAASSLTDVTLIDGNPNAGGQIWRAELLKRDPASASLLSIADSGRLDVRSGTQIYDIQGREAFAESNNCRLEIEFGKLIIATGARELFLPFPGWTLPNVMGAGGLQALVKGGLNIANKRVVVAGTGPLLLAVAEYIKRKGAEVAAIVEQAPRSQLAKFAFGLLRSPSKLRQAIGLRAKLSGIPYMTDSWIRAAHGEDRLRSVDIMRNGKVASIECDYLACGFHLVPSLELAQLAGCTIDKGGVVVDEIQQTSINDVFCAGEATGIGGVDCALIEGEIAGLAASGQSNAARRLHAKRKRARRFADALNRTFDLREELRSLAGSDTIVCRCEDVELGELTEFENFREAKLQTRCGMGPCQGRVCGAAAQFLFGWDLPSVRPPIFPVKMEHL